ncbi:MAG: hypothetical protein AAGA47_03460 [Pseudomonadota bacterium]
MRDKSMLAGYPKYAALAAVVALSGCGGSGSPFLNSTEPSSDDQTVDDTAPVTTSNNAFLFDTGRNLTANSFVYDPITDTIVINNLPFDNTDATGNSYFNAGVIGGTTTPYYQSTSVPGGNFTYFAVILQSASGFSFGGSVATGNFGDFGFGGVYIERTASGLPAAQPESYIYTGQYAGTRVVGNGGMGDDDVGLVLGDAELEVDLLDLDTGGSAIGGVTGRTLYDSDGNVVGNLASLQLNLADIQTGNAELIDGDADVRNADGTNAQGGEWFGYFSGPNGEEIVGYVVVEGIWSDNDVGFSDADDVEPATIRETGVFIVER